MTTVVSTKRKGQTIGTDRVTAVDSQADWQAKPRGRLRNVRHPARWIGILVGLVGSIVIIALAVAPQSTYSEVNSPLLGHQAPPVRGTSIVGGHFDLGTLRGHFVVVDFFATWCVPCRTEQPELVKFAEQQQSGALLVGVIFKDTVASAQSFVGPWAGLYPVLADPGGNTALDYGVYNPPSKYVIDPGGRVVAKIIGPVTAFELNVIIARAAKRGS